MITRSEMQGFIEYGIKAPSGHNTQPWKFLVSENFVEIYPDLGRSLPVVDPDLHALFISLGCAAENCILAAKASGYNTVLSIIKDHKGVDFIRIKFEQGENPVKDDLIDYIDRRQVTRNSYSEKPVSIKDINKLLTASRFDGIRLNVYNSEEEIKLLEPLIIAASNLQFQNTRFVDELVDWIRFSKGEVEKKRDGIWHASMGMPGLGRLIGNFVMKRLVSAKSEAKRWKKLIKSSPAFILFVTEKNDVAHWVKLGRSFQRFGLMATKIGLSHAHVNMPCEELEIRNQLAIKLNLGTTHPLLLIRLGYSNKMPYSYRRPIEEVIRGS